MTNNLDYDRRRNLRTAILWTLIADVQLLLLVFAPEATASFPGQSTLAWKWLAFALSAGAAAMYWFQFAHTSRRSSGPQSARLDGGQR